MSIKIGKFAATIALAATATTHAFIGFGIHWGFVDNTLYMEDKFNQPITASTGNFDAGEMLNNVASSSPEFSEAATLLDNALNGSSIEIPNGPTISNSQDLFDYVGSESSNLTATLPISLSRSDWSRSLINFGGKFFLDKIKFIDAVEASFNIGVWEYTSTLNYPTGTRDNITKEDVEEFINTGDYGRIFQMDSIDLTLENMGINYLKMFGVSETPYSKFNIDITIRKNLISLPKTKRIFRLYLGAGVSFHLATPIMTPEFVNDVINNAMDTANNNINEILANIKNDEEGDPNELMDMIVDKLVEEAKDPTFGMHLIAGTHIKLPVIPLGIYIDGKFMIPFGDMDEHVDLGGFGFVVNTGISLSFGN